MELEIIDAHLHFVKDAYFDTIARAAKHENSAEHLEKVYKELGIVRGIVMGNVTLSLEGHNYPKFLNYCIGLDMGVFQDWVKHLSLIEEHLKRRECVGIKLYPGYLPFYVYDDSLSPIYRLAEKYNKPVAVHTGLTAMSNALLKYAHPLTLDEAAAKFPAVNFVMCHLGEPWFCDAVSVLEKNPNVFADLSGILEGKLPNVAEFLNKKKFFVEQLKGRLEYLDDYEKLMFGTDWPLANLSDYIEFTKAIIPQSEWKKVFHDNAEKIYNL